MAELAPGDIFAGHRIEGVAGRGGFGVVYRARHLALDHVVALKLISGERAADPTFRERFQSESRIAVSIRHPNVVAVHHAGEEDGLLFVTMDFIEGTDLRGLLNRERRLRPEDASAIISPVASALDAAHERGLVHRDIKPGNVLIEERRGDRHVFLTDFGLSKKIDATSGVTATGAFVGTLDYVAPEQIKGERVDARTDVYALGCVLYELLTGEVPYGGEIEKVAKMYAHLQEPPPSLSEKAPDVPAALGDAVRRAMEKDPDRRFPSAGDLARAATAAAVGREPSQPERSVGVGAAAPTQAFDSLAAPAGAAGEETAEARRVGESPLKTGSDRYPGDTARYSDSTAAPQAPEVPTEQPPSPPSNAAGRPRRGVILGGVALAAIAVGAFVLLSGGDGGDDTGGGGGGEGDAQAKVVGDPIKVPANPVSVAVGDDDLFVSSQDGKAVVRLDPANGQETGRFDLPSGTGKQLAMADGSVWVATGEAGSDVGSVVELDAGTLDPIETFPVGVDPRGIALDNQFAWVANYGADTVSRIDLDGGDPVSFPSGGELPARVAQSGDSIWVSNAGSGIVTRFSEGSERGEPIRVGAPDSEPRGMVFAEGLLWVALAADGVVTAIDPAEGRVLSDVEIDAGKFPLSMAFGFGSVWVTNRDDGTVSRIDPKSQKAVGHAIEVGGSPEGIAVDEASDRVWVTTGTGDSVVQIDPTG